MRNINETLAVEHRAAMTLHQRYHVPLSLAQDFAANCGLVSEQDIVSVFFEHFPEYVPDKPDVQTSGPSVRAPGEPCMECGAVLPTQHVKSIEQENTGGNCVVTIITLTDDKVLVIDHEMVGLWPSRAAFGSGGWEDGDAIDYIDRDPDANNFTRMASGES